MPTLGQKVDMLFKKFIALKGTVNSVGSNSASFTPATSAYFQEQFASKMTVSAEQVWTQSKYIPTATNPLNTSLPTTPTNLQRLRGGVATGDLYTDTMNSTTGVLTVDNIPVLKRLELQLRPVPGAPNTWAFLLDPAGSPGTGGAVGSTEWVAAFGNVSEFKGYNILPFSYDATGTLFRYELFRTRTGSPGSYSYSNPIPFLDASDWFFDQDALVLNFNAESLPSGVTTSSNLYIRVYRYIGSVGDFGTTVDTSDLQKAALGYIQNANQVSDVTSPHLLNSNISTYFHLQSAMTLSGTSFAAKKMVRYNATTSAWVEHIRTEGDRWLFRDVPADYAAAHPTEFPSGTQTLANIGVFDLSSGTPTWTPSASIVQTHIVEFHTDGSNNGYYDITPVTGWRIIVKDDANKIWLFDGTSWIEEGGNGSTSYSTLSNKDMVGNVTTADGQEAVATGLVTLPAAAGYIEVQVNGVSIKLGTDDDLIGGTFKPSAVFAKLLPTPYTAVLSGSVYNITFPSAHNLLSGDIITLTSNAGTNYVTPVTVSSNVVSVPNTVIATSSNKAYLVRDFQSINAADKLLWFGSNAKFELDGNDRISYIYIVPQS